MEEEKTLKDICPYCLNPVTSESMDHIFPQFLGGKAKINSCKKCNNTFGHTFEAKASRVLLPIHYLLAGWGLKSKSQSPPLQLRHLDDDNTYKLFLAEDGMKYSLARPIIKRDENGEILSGSFTEQKDAEEFVQNLISKGKVKEMELKHNSESGVEATGMDYTLELGPDIRRLALKMCIGLATKLPQFDLEEVADARCFLVGEEKQNDVGIVLTAFDSYEEIDSMRKGLSHVIYVERNENYLSGLVQFYGHLQFFCHLGISSEAANNAAMFASLDPLTGEENFSQVSPLRLDEPPFMINEDEIIALGDGWLNKFKEEAASRGATNPILKQGKKSFLKKSED
jgi:hypothetical protein